MSHNNPYRDETKPVSPLYFGYDEGRPIMMDLREIRTMELNSEGSWFVFWKNTGHYYNLKAEDGANLYRHLQAYNESHYA